MVGIFTETSRVLSYVDPLLKRPNLAKGRQIHGVKVASWIESLTGRAQKITIAGKAVYVNVASLNKFLWRKAITNFPNTYTGIEINLKPVDHFRTLKKVDQNSTEKIESEELINQMVERATNLSDQEKQAQIPLLELLAKRACEIYQKIKKLKEGYYQGDYNKDAPKPVGRVYWKMKELHSQFDYEKISEAYAKKILDRISFDLAEKKYPKTYLETFYYLHDSIVDSNQPTAEMNENCLGGNRGTVITI